MKKTFFALLAAMSGCVPCHAAWTVNFAITNFDLTLATNGLRILKAQDSPLVDGTYLTLGSPIKVPTTNGLASKVLLAGNYELRIEGYTLPRPIYFAVPEGAGTSDLVGDPGLRISGVNFFKYTPGVRDASISSNKMDATAYAAFIGGGGSSIAPFGVSSTNTFYAVNTNAITIVSNPASFTRITINSGADANTRQITGTYYPTANPYVMTNGATKALWFDGGTYDSYMIFTNSAHPDAVGDGSDIAAYYYSGYNLLNDSSFSQPDSWADNFSEFNILTVTGSSVLAYAPHHAKHLGEFSGSFVGNYIGNGSAISNVPTASNVITNNRSASAGGIFLTNTVFTKQMSQMGEDYDLRFNYFNDSTNLLVINSNGISMAGATTYDRGINWQNSYMRLGANNSFLLRAGSAAIEAFADNSSIRFTDDHRLDGLVKLAGQSIVTAYASNQYSGMLGFQSFDAGGSSAGGFSGIRGKNPDGVTVQSVDGVNFSQSEMWFYSLIPPQLSNSLGGFRIVGDTNWFMIGHTNGVNIKTNAYVLGKVFATNGIASVATSSATIASTGWTNTIGVNATLAGFTGVSVWQTNYDGSAFSRGTITAPTDITLQIGEKLIGTSCAVGKIKAW